MRLFASVDLDPLAARIAELQEPFADLPGVRLTDPELAHITIAFLGEVEAKRLPAVERAVGTGVRDALAEPFPVEVGGFGVFPDPDYITVVWLGVRRGVTALRRLHRRVERTLNDAALPCDTEEEFVPHVTIARVDHGGAKERIQELVADDPDVGSVRVESVELVDSTRTADGPEYETVCSWKL
jgi:2'-5' RNA ligase